MWRALYSIENAVVNISLHHHKIITLLKFSLAYIKMECQKKKKMECQVLAAF